MEIVDVKISELVEDPLNARTHDKRNIDAIKASLERFGQVEPLVVRAGSNVVVGGNGRLAAMRSLEWKAATVTYQELTDAQAAALGITLNRTAELAAWDNEQLATTLENLIDAGDGVDELLSIGFNSDELERISVSAHSRAPATPNPSPPLIVDVSLEELADRVEVLHGDCLEVMRGLDDSCVDAVVTDPPAGIAFMGKAWDGDKGGRDQWIDWMRSVMVECLRVLKPGGHALVWALPRTSHWTGTAIEAAGFDVRDQIYHLFGTGFPKSLDVSKAIDTAAGVDREVLAERPAYGIGKNTGVLGGLAEGAMQKDTVPATEDAKRWQGWGTALKPAAEVWWLSRKPLEGTVAANVLKHGTGGLNIGATRVGDELRHNPSAGNDASGEFLDSLNGDETEGRGTLGRWPAHVVHDGGDEAVERLPDGSARFFYCAKPSTTERDEGLGGVAGVAGVGALRDGGRESSPRRNDHPTVKPIALMRWLVRLITPPGGVVLDPFTGSGTTGIASLQEGFSFVGIEQDESHYRKAKARILDGARRTEA